MFLDFGSALKAGTDEYYKAQDIEQAKAREQEKLTLWKKQQQRLADSQDIQNQQALMKLKEMNNQLIKRDTYDALDKYVVDKDPKHINNLIKNPDVQQLWTSDPSNPPVRYEHPESEEDYQKIASKYGMTLEAAKENSARFLKEFRANGQVDYFPEDNLYMLTGWFKHADDEKLQKIRQQLELQNLVSGNRSERSKTELEKLASIKAKPLDKRTPEEQAFLDLYTQKTKSSLDKKIDALKGNLPKMLEIGNEYVKNDLIIPENALSDLLAVQTQIGGKLPTHVEKEVTSSIPILKIGSETLSTLNSMAPDDYAAGVVDKGIQEIGKLMSDSDFLHSSPEEKARILKNVRIQSDLGYMLAKFVQSISGAAVSNEEFARLANVVTSGAYSNKYTLMEALNSFLRKVQLTNKEQLKSYFNEAPYSVANKWNRLVSVKIPEVNTDKQMNEQAQIEPKTRSFTEKTKDMVSPIIDNVKKSIGMKVDKSDDKEQKFKEIMKRNGLL